MTNQALRMVGGLTLVAELLTMLLKLVVKHGGCEEMLHFLTTKPGRENLEKVAELIVSLKWTIPKSVMMRMARENSLHEYPNGEYADSDEHFLWQPVLNDLGIPYLGYSMLDPGTDDHHWWPIPMELCAQLQGKPAIAGMVVDFEGEPHVVAGFGGDGDPKVGDIISTEDIHFIHLVRAVYLDLEN